MQRRRVGSSGLEVSRIGLGTMTLGRRAPTLDEAAAQLAAFVEAGGTLVETADGYGDGAAQQVLGEVLAGVGAAGRAGARRARRRCPAARSATARPAARCSPGWTRR